MQHTLRRTLIGAVFVLLASCGGGGSPDPAGQAQGLRAADAIRTEAKLGAREGSSRGDKVYIVRLAEPAVAGYDGGIRGHAATRPAKGSKLDAKHPDVVSYRSLLAARQEAVMRGAGVSSALRSYGYVFNGFAARLSDAQVSKLAGTPGVLSIAADERRYADTSFTPSFLGLSGRDGFWKEQDAKGENIIIGIVDSGIWPEHPSFADHSRRPGDGWRRGDDGDDERGYAPIRGWNGTCVSGEQFTEDDCNRKLIGARYYNAAWGGDAGIKAAFPYEFNSPRDYDGHGTHTSSTAGGNEGVRATGDASVFGKISGIAPRARIAMYKALWHDSSVPTSTGFTSDLVAAIDDAVADGVDVINYSISGTRTNFADPVEIAFLFAADAGVFVATSAGNSGPTVGTVAHPSPWVTTVAAGTHSRDGRGSATLGNGTTLTGASYTAAVGPAPLIDGSAAVAPGANPDEARRCLLAIDSPSGAPTLDPAKVSGKIVVCDRGTNVLVNKAKAVKDAGGVGMILTNVAGGATTTLPILHVVPTVHIAYSDATYTGLKSYAAGAGATATIAAATLTFDLPAPLTASFSSRGPLLAGGGSVLKPDLIAPGQDILAGVAPPANSGRLFDVFSGTSMSSPHVAGLAALMKEVHPRWSPMAIKSALMTTGADVLDGPGTEPVIIFRQGAGHVRPNNAADPGLVFDSGFDDWLGFLCGTAIDPANCTASGVPVLDPSDLNAASIAIGSMAGSRTITRRVTNVSNAIATYRPSITGMAGFDVSFSPASLTLARGQTKSFSVTFTRTSAALNAYTGGQLTLNGGTSWRGRQAQSVRIPVVVKPVALAAPPEVNGSYSVKFGYTGPFTATARGLVAANTTDGSVATNGAVDKVVNIPEGTTYARFSLFDANVGAPSDLDLEVRNAAGTLVGASGGATANEEVNLVSPAAGAYTVRVVGFATPGNAAVSFTLFNWTLGSTAAGNMTVSAPASATTGGTGTISLAFSNLAAGIKYLGSVVYGGGPALPAPTIVRVDP